MNFLNAAMTNSSNILFAGIGITVFVILMMIFFLVTMKMDLSDMKKRYRKMMVGSEGEDIETLLTKNTNKILRFSEELERLSSDVGRIDSILERAITRVSIVRFNAFEDTSSELSYCIALLDDNNTGVIISAINGREESRSYAKPIINGKPAQYKLTKEEEQALNDAAEKGRLVVGNKRF